MANRYKRPRGGRRNAATGGKPSASGADSAAAAGKDSASATAGDLPPLDDLPPAPQLAANATADPLVTSATDGGDMFPHGAGSDSASRFDLPELPPPPPSLPAGKFGRDTVTRAQPRTRGHVGKVVVGVGVEGNEEEKELSPPAEFDAPDIAEAVEGGDSVESGSTTRSLWGSVSAHSRRSDDLPPARELIGNSSTLGSGQPLSKRMRLTPPLEDGGLGSATTVDVRAPVPGMDGNVALDMQQDEVEQDDGGEVFDDPFGFSVAEARIQRVRPHLKQYLQYVGQNVVPDSDYGDVHKPYAAPPRMSPAVRHSIDERTESALTDDNQASMPRDPEKSRLQLALANHGKKATAPEIHRCGGGDDDNEDDDGDFFTFTYESSSFAARKQSKVLAEMENLHNKSIRDLVKSGRGRVHGRGRGRGGRGRGGRGRGGRGQGMGRGRQPGRGDGDSTSRTAAAEGLQEETDKAMPVSSPETPGTGSDKEVEPVVVPIVENEKEQSPEATSGPSSATNNVVPDEEKDLKTTTPVVKRGRGRPRRNPAPVTVEVNPDKAKCKAATRTSAKRGPGRPRKRPSPVNADANPDKAKDVVATTISVVKRGRGRPRKHLVEAQS